MKIIVITGATASGKTGLAIKLAKKINAQIISADSRIVYKDIDIAGAKPTIKEMDGVIHHLIDVVEPVSVFSAGDFCTLAKEKIEDIKKQGQNIIIAGGSWFYIKCLLDKEKLIPIGKNEALRNKLNKLESNVLWQKLNELDSLRASKIHPNNKDKIIRSIELCMGLNKPLTAAAREKNNYEAIWFMPQIERDALYENINKRVDIMFEMGLFEEWQRNKTKYPNSDVLRNTIGYKELYDFEEGKYKDIEEAIEKIKQHTRNFAKRQLTYFRSRNDIKEIRTIDELYYLLPS